MTTEVEDTAGQVLAKGETVGAAPTPAPAPAPAPASKVTPIQPTSPPAQPLLTTIAAAPEPEDFPAPDPLLVQILSTKRAHESVGDTNFRTWLVNYLRKTLKVKPTTYKSGNIVVITDEKSDTLFSTHIDTMHSVKESDGTQQKLAYDPAFGHLFLAEQTPMPGCLGADDGAGIYLLLKMIKHKVPGTFIFHIGEERGGIGSRQFRKDEPEFLKSFSRAVAFDRRNGGEVICTQGGQVCASIEAGNALCAELNKHDMTYVVSHKGSFTDTKVYSDVINECFNVAVGYDHEHSPDEMLDVGHLNKLLKAVLAIQWDFLPAPRKPVPNNVPPPYKGHYAGSSGYGGHRSSRYDDADLIGDHLYGNGGGSLPSKFPAPNSPEFEGLPRSMPSASAPFLREKAVEPKLSLVDEICSYSYEDLQEFTASDDLGAANVIWRLTARIRAYEAELEHLNRALGE